jgi:RES domain-containing protein
VRKLWRISNYCDLSGIGGEKYDARWHTAARGKRIVYLAEHPAVALIEILVNLKGDPSTFPEKYQLMEIDVEDRVMAACQTLEDSPGPEDPISATQGIGNAWLKSRKSALLAVPSIPSPMSTNYLLNPLHPDASGIKVVSCQWIEYDQRLFRVRKGQLQGGRAALAAVERVKPKKRSRSKTATAKRRTKK